MNRIQQETICQHDGCHAVGEALFYPDGSPAYFCVDHMGPAGFCLGCGGFFGGAESFHFGEPRYLCDDCRSDPELVGGDEWYEDEETDA